MANGRKHSVLRNRNFAILFSGQIVSKLGNNLYLLALPWYVYSTTGSKSALAVTGFLQSIPIILGVFVGVWVDRWHKRTTMILVDLLRIFIAFGLFLVTMFHGALWLLILLVLVVESVGKFYTPASSSLIPLVVPSEDIVAAEGMNQSGGATAQLIAFFGGGALMQLTGPTYLFLAYALTFLVSVISLLFIRVSENISPSETPSFFREWTEGLKLSFKSRRILIIFVAAMTANFAFAAMDIVITAWIQGPVHGTALTLGLFGGLFFGGMLVGGLLLEFVNRHLSVMTILTWGLIVSGVFTTVLGMYTSLWWLLPLVCIMGFANGLMNGSLNARFVTIVPAHMRGRIFGTLNALGSIMTPLGMAVYGWLLTFLPLSVLFVVIGIPVVLSGLSLFIPTTDDMELLSQVSV